jgi:LPXTG-site transpeptidase (sortase) family protein
MTTSPSKNSRGVERVSISEKIWEFIRFTVVTGMVFVVSFFALNFTAYKQILTGIFNPEVQAKAQETLEVANEGGKATSSSSLLPVLPDKKEEHKSFAWLNFPIAPTDNRLVVPKLGKSIPIVETGDAQIQGADWGQLEKQIQSGLQKGVVHYPGTAKPGEFGNVFITGHSSYYPWDPGQYKDVFATLSKLEVGDMYYVYYNQKQYSYEVTSKMEVKPSNVDVLSQPKDEKISTLMTCTPVGTALRRLIITAKEV